MIRFSRTQRILATLVAVTAFAACSGNGGDVTDTDGGDVVSVDCATGDCLEDARDPDDGLTPDDGVSPPDTASELPGADTPPRFCEPADCDDGDPCTEDMCKEGFGCQHLPKTCDDGDGCTDDACDPDTGECVHGAVACDDDNLCTEELCDPAEGCVYTTITCDDGDPCTSDGCTPDGGCVFQPLTCADGNPCTDDWCDPVTGCQHQAVADPECCATDLDCEDGSPCTDDACVAATCVHIEVPGMVCCEEDVDCADGNDCTDDICIEQICNYFAAGEGCCEDALDCEDEDGCTNNLCVDFTCVLEQIPSCCHDDGDCDDDEACSQDLCSMTGGDFGFCQNTPIPNCCHDDVAECDDQDVCTIDFCPGMGAVCEYTPVEGCCNSPSDCDDGDECTLEICMNHQCLWSDLCCTTAEDCDDGDDICTLDECVDGYCLITHTGAPGCCEVPLFEDDFSTDKGWFYGVEWERGPATASVGSVYNDDPGYDFTGSDDNYIAGVVIGGMASTDLHGYYYLTSPVVSVTTPGPVYFSYRRWLNSDYSPYMINVVEVFNGAAWVNLWITGSSPGINDSAWTFHEWDVTNHANPDMRVRFGFEIGSGGVYSISSWNLDDVKVIRKEAPLCCAWDTDCETGALEAEPVCMAGMCSSGECQVDEQCADEDPCTEDLCTAGECVHQPIPECCVEDEDCDDGDACTMDACKGGTCAHQDILYCCSEDADCDDGDDCTDDACVDNECENTPIPDCE